MSETYGGVLKVCVIGGHTIDEMTVFQAVEDDALRDVRTGDSGLQIKHTLTPAQ